MLRLQIPFKEYAEEWQSLRVVSPSTRSIQQIHLERHVYPHIGHERLANLTPTKIQSLIKKLEQTPARQGRAANIGTAPEGTPNLKPKTIQGIMGTVQQILNAAVADDRIARNPMLRNNVVRLPKVEKRLVVPWTPEQVTSVREGIGDHYAVLVELAAGLGLRQGEVFGLAVEDVDFLGGSVHVRRQLLLDKSSRPYFGLPKGGRTRTVPLPTRVQEALAAHIASAPPVACTLPWCTPEGTTRTASLILTTETGLPVRRDHFNKRYMKPAVEAAGLEPNRDNMTHALRHFYASVMLAAGRGIKDVSEWLGHSTPMITLTTYAHLMPQSPEQKRRDVDAVLSDVFAPNVDEMLSRDANRSRPGNVSAGQTRFRVNS